MLRYDNITGENPQFHDEIFQDCPMSRDVTARTACVFERHSVASASASHTHRTQSQWHHGARAELWLLSRPADGNVSRLSMSIFKNSMFTATCWVQHLKSIKLSDIIISTALCSHVLGLEYFFHFWLNIEYRNCYSKLHAQKLYWIAEQTLCYRKSRRICEKTFRSLILFVTGFFIDRVNLLEPCDLTASISKKITKISSTHKFLLIYESMFI